MNLTDVLLGVGLVLSVLSFAFASGYLQTPLWVIVPVASVALFILRDVAVLGRPLISEYTPPTYFVGDSVGQEVAGPLPFLFRLTMCLVVVTLVISTRAFSDDKGVLVLLIAFWVGGAAISAGFAFLQRTFGVPDLFFSFHITSVERAVGLANHPNSLGQASAMAVPVVMYFLVSGTGWVRRVLAAFALALVGFGVVASGSRAAWLIGLAGAVVTTVWLLWRSRYRFALIPLAVVVVGGGALALPALLTRSRLNPEIAGASNTERIQALQEGWSYFTQSPVLGSGVSIWIGEMVPLILLSGGGVVLLLLFLMSFSVPVVAMARRASSRLIFVLLLSSVMILAFGLLNNAIVERYLYWPTAIGYFLCVAQAEFQRTRVLSLYPFRELR